MPGREMLCMHRTNDIASIGPMYFVVSFGRRASAGEEIDHHCAMASPASALAVALPLALGPADQCITGPSFIGTDRNLAAHMQLQHGSVDARWVRAYDALVLPAAAPSGARARVGGVHALVRDM